MDGDNGISLNDYHQQRNQRLMKERSKQRVMSPEECVEQSKRIAAESRDDARRSGSAMTDRVFLQVSWRTSKGHSIEEPPYP
jgi:hypothetical protein